MAFRGNNQIEQGKKGARRTWTKQEEEALVGILKDLVARGHRCENGSFKPGTNLIIEKALTDTFPTCGLKSTPHIDSKMKVWRKNYSIVFDMVSKSEFRWNDVHNCVEVDSDEVWETYVQHHKEARGWRGKPFPFYDKLQNIFGIDHATGRGIETLANTVDDIERNETHTNDLEVEEECVPSTDNQTSSTNSIQSSRRKRRRSYDNRSDGLEKLAESLVKMMDKSNTQVKMIVHGLEDAIQKKDDDQYNFIWNGLTKLDIPIDDQIKALKLIAQEPWNVSVFKALDDSKKLDWVRSLLRISKK
ncbi:uncharacterized protein LOC21412590 [Morus notabilis]|uniref:uncharacterized protein LOC21412590 n=1 Tax=Morus notabilis TaxID=981085 RepID=UPI000CED2C62|nr:uncharacterized protein LOC21412590 [Morus notabilis]XP_024029942.1 uncharacterized protein LOC21412590 [Morus notabilis]